MNARWIPDFVAGSLRAHHRKVLRRRSGARRQQLGCEAGLHHVLSHDPVSGPFTAYHGDQAAFAHQHGVLTRQALRGCSVVIRRLHQRPQADPDTFDVGWSKGATQVAGRFPQNEIVLILECTVSRRLKNAVGPSPALPASAS